MKAKRPLGTATWSPGSVASSVVVGAEDLQPALVHLGVGEDDGGPAGAHRDAGGVVVQVGQQVAVEGGGRCSGSGRRQTS
jgi:hypothetical protein